MLFSMVLINKKNLCIGSNFGEDWTNLADIIIPHQQMYKDAEFTFKTLVSVKEVALVSFNNFI